MKDFYCLFSDEMARAVVEGRKGVTRRPGVDLPPFDMDVRPEIAGREPA